MIGNEFSFRVNWKFHHARANLVEKIGATVSKVQKERRVSKVHETEKKRKRRREEHEEGDGARPRGAAHKICLHSPEKKSDEEGSRSAGNEGERVREWRRTAKNKGGAENVGTV